MYDGAAVSAQKIEKIGRLRQRCDSHGPLICWYPDVPKYTGIDERGEEGTREIRGIVRIVYICCLVLAIGGSAASLVSNFPKEKQLAIFIDVSISKLGNCT